MTSWAQLSLEAALTAKREGMQRAYEHAGAAWKVIAEEAARRLLSERRYVTADDRCIGGEM